MQDTSALYVSNSTELLLRACGEETLVYNRASGETHLLDYTGAALLAQFMAAGQTRESLCLQLSELALPVSATDFPDYLDEVIRQFLALHLIEETGRPLT